MSDYDELPMVDLGEPTENLALVRGETFLPVQEPFKRIEIGYGRDDQFGLWIGDYGFDERGMFAQPTEANPLALVYAVGVLIDIQDAALWAIGDALLAGEVKYSELFAQAEEGDGRKMSYTTLRKIKWTCKTFPRADRIVPLGIWYYAEVAGVADRELRLELLMRAWNEGWSQRRLRQESEKAREVPLIHRPVTVYPYDPGNAAEAIARKAPDSRVLRYMAAELELWAVRIDDGYQFSEEE